MEQRFVDLFGLAKYTELIRKYSLMEFKDILKHHFTDVTRTIEFTTACSVCLEIGKFKIYFTTKAGPCLLPLYNDFESHHWPTESQIADPIDCVLHYIKNGTFPGIQSDFAEIHVRAAKYYKEWKKYNYLASALNLYVKCDKPNEECRKILLEMGLRYDNGYFKIDN